MHMFSFTNEELEDTADIIKTAVLHALMNDGLLTPEIADQWAMLNTIVHRKKSFFRTLTDKWQKEKTVDNQYYYLVVARRVGK